MMFLSPPDVQDLPLSHGGAFPLLTAEKSVENPSGSAVCITDDCVLRRGTSGQLWGLYLICRNH